MRTRSELFWCKVEVLSSDKCWEWKAYLNNKGYGKFADGNGGNVYAHRISWELTRGKIPDGKWVLHKCDNPACVNPDHLFIGDHDDNSADMVAKGRGRSGGGKRPGQLHPGAKLSAVDVVEIRSMLQLGILQKEIGSKFNVSQALVSLIKKGSLWSRLGIEGNV